MNRAVPNFNKISIEQNCGNCGHTINANLDWKHFSKSKYKKHPEDPCDSYCGSITCGKCKSEVEVLLRIMITTYDSIDERKQEMDKLKPGDKEQIEKTAKMVSGNQSLI